MVVMMMVMRMIVVVAVIMMVVVVIMTLGFKAAKAGTEAVAKRTILDVGAGRRRTLPFNVVVVAFLHRAHFRLESQHLRAVFAHDAGGRRCGVEGRVSGAFFDGDGGALGGGDLYHLFAFDRQDLRAVLAGCAIGGRHLACLFGDAVGKGGKDAVMIAQVARFGELHLGMRGGDLIGETIDTVDQNA